MRVESLLFKLEIVNEYRAKGGRLGDGWVVYYSQILYRRCRARSFYAKLIWITADTLI